MCKGKQLLLASAAVLATASPLLAQATDRSGGTGEGSWPAAGWIAWLVIGLIAGFLASLTVNRRGEGIIWDIVLGVIGAYIGGVIFHAFGAPGVTGFNAWSVLVAFAGAVILLFIYHMIIGQRSRRAA